MCEYTYIYIYIHIYIYICMDGAVRLRREEVLPKQPTKIERGLATLRVEWVFTYSWDAATRL